MNNRINILVMPTDVCNMNCIYCFHNTYHEKAGKMNLDTLKKLYDSVFASYKQALFIWHGGEPLCMGLDFYKKAIEFQKNYKDVSIENRMQSNLTLLTDEMADFLCDNNIGIGTSYDGINNEILRGNSENILNGRQKLLDRGKKCGIIMVLSKKNIDTLIESYNFFKEINANFTLNTYVSTVSEINDELELDVNHTLFRLKQLFDVWINDFNCNIHIDYFERFIEFILYNRKRVCKYNSCLGKWLGIRYDGTIVPCNRYFPPEYSMGNVWDYEKISKAFQSSGFELLLSQAIKRRYRCQRDCEIYSFCCGGCNNVALNENGITKNNGTTCLITRGIYRYIKEYISKININEKSFHLLNPVLKKMYLSYYVEKNKCHCDIHYDSRN